MQPIIIASIAAFAAILAATVTASLGYYFTKKHQVRIEERKLKEEYYRSFIKALSDAVIDNADEDANDRLSEAFNSLIVIGSPPVVKQIMEYHDLVRTDSKHPAESFRDSPEWKVVHDKALREVIKAIRQDIFGSEKNIDAYLQNVHLVGGPRRRPAAEHSALD